MLPCTRSRREGRRGHRPSTSAFTAPGAQHLLEMSKSFTIRAHHKVVILEIDRAGREPRSALGWRSPYRLLTISARCNE